MDTRSLCVWTWSLAMYVLAGCSAEHYARRLVDRDNTPGKLLCCLRGARARLLRDGAIDHAFRVAAPGAVGGRA